MKKSTFLLFLILSLTQLCAQTPRLVTPIGHTKGIEAIAISPDGKYILTGSTDFTAKLWDLKGHEIRTFKGHTKEVAAVAFSPDGKKIVTADQDAIAILWDLNGNILQRFEGHKKYIESVAFSPDGKYILTGGRDNKAILWSLDGQEVQKFKGHEKDINTVAFSPDSQRILTASKDSTAIIWDLNGTVLQTLTGHKGKVKGGVFAPDGQSVLTCSDDKTAILWSLSGEILQVISGHTDQVNMAVFSPDGAQILTGSHDLSARLWDLKGNQLQEYRGHKTTPSRITVAFAPNGKSFVTGSKDGTAILWDLKGHMLQIFKGHAQGISAVDFSYADGGKQLLTGSVDGTVRRWAPEQNMVILYTGHVGWVRSVCFSPYDSPMQVLTGGDDYTARLWDLDGKALLTLDNPDVVTSVAFSPGKGSKQLLTATGLEAKIWDTSGKELQTLTDDESVINGVSFAPGGKQILTAGGTEARLWSLDGQMSVSFTGHEGWVTSAVFAPDGKFILTGSDDNTARTWSLDGSLLHTFEGHTKGISAVAFSPNGNGRVLTSSFDHTARLWDMNGKVFHILTGHENDIQSAKFSPDGKFVLTGSLDNTAKLWDSNTGKELATLMAVDADDWVVTSPSGMFDASPGAMNLMYFVVGLEVIELEQLKERYYEPGLLAKILGLSKDPARSVQTFKDVALYPEMVAALNADKTQVEIKLTPRNGGIGKLSVFVNGKEVKEDANPNRNLALNLPLDDFYRYCLPDTTNKLALRVYNDAGWLKSQALELELEYKAPTSKGAEPGTTRRSSLLNRRKISFHAIVIGTSNYASEKLKLKFADHDAASMSTALRLLAPGVFENRVNIMLLNTDSEDSTRVDVSSKTTIRKAFEEVAEEAQPQDVLLIYFAGHGVNYGTAEKSQFYYLTKDIVSENLQDDAIRENFAISATEITDWVKAIPALKQVLILDACNSGKLVDDLASGSRDLNSAQVRALDRMKDRTGMFIITGSAADMVSYETTMFRHGLLTYSLLQGMNGLALGDDNSVDVMTLFQYSRNKVPELAKGINGVQIPVLAFPTTGASFDIGLKSSSVDIPVGEEKPVFIKSALNDKVTFNDPLDLGNVMDAYFQKLTVKPAQAPIIYSRATGYENGYAIRGNYVVSGNEVQISGGLIKGKESLATFELTADKTNIEGIPAAIMEKVWPIVQQQTNSH
ncbi:MAG: hypothetical protein EP344_14710 [Bacteroidetes bacterium]|nr:MAG: hypothetical protein EP344_14710 [Bacteroidota bacterium]